MKKIFFLCFFSAFFGFIPHLQAHVQGSIKGKISYYYPINHTFRKIYDERAFYGVEGSIQAFKDLFVYTGVNLLPSSGQSIGENSKTDLWLVPLEVGLKYFFPIQNCYYEIYVAAAAAPFYVHIKDDSPFVVRKRTKWDIGGSFKGGLLLFPTRTGFMIDIFLNYFLLKSDFSDTDKTVGRRADFSGLSAGTGIGYWF